VDPDAQRRDAFLAAFLDLYDLVMSRSAGGAFGAWLFRHHLGCLLLPFVLVAGIRTSGRTRQAQVEVVRLYQELTGKDRIGADADVYRIERKLVLLQISEPVTEDDADDAPDTERAELELAAAALLDVALQGGQTDDELMLEIQAAFEALDEAVTAEELTTPIRRVRRVDRGSDDDATRAALEQRYWQAWRRWFERRSASPA
jgi:hypothetical protein